MRNVKDDENMEDLCGNIGRPGSRAPLWVICDEYPARGKCQRRHYIDNEILTHGEFLISVKPVAANAAMPMVATSGRSSQHQDVITP